MQSGEDFDDCVEAAFSLGFERLDTPHPWPQRGGAPAPEPEGRLPPARALHDSCMLNLDAGTGDDTEIPQIHVLAQGVLATPSDKTLCVISCMVAGSFVVSRCYT